MSVDDWFKPPLTVFIVWGGFVLCFLLCGSSKRLCGFFCCECDDDPIDYDEETYEHLSSRRRQELDNLRSIAILRKLTRFTLTLQQENMLKKLPDAGSQNLDEDNPGEIELSSSVRRNSQSEGVKQGEKNDIELGASNSVLASIENNAAEVNQTESGSEYTHVLIPHPSYNVDGKQVKELEECNEDEKKSNSIKLKVFRRKAKERTEENNNEAKEGSDDEIKKCATEVEDEAIEEPDPKSTEKREVPIFCAVCLMEYSVSERVCWASNDECTHVFHEDCVLQWLVSLGRKRSKRQSFPRNPSERRLLDYDLSCPCCRQDFISKNLVLAPDPEGDENA